VLDNTGKPENFKETVIKEFKKMLTKTPLYNKNSKID